MSGRSRIKYIQIEEASVRLLWRVRLMMSISPFSSAFGLPRSWEQAPDGIDP